MGGDKVGYLNLINGSFFIDDSYKSKSLHDFYVKSNKQEKKRLTKLGFILNQKETTFVKDYLDYLKEKSENLIPDALIFVLGFECNFCCPYCTPTNYSLNYGSNRIAKTEGLDLKKCFELIRSKKYLLKAAKKRIGFYGGELFLNFPKRHEQIKELFSELRAIKPKKVIIPTNGYDLNFFFDDLKQLTDKRIEVVLQITLDGPPRLHNLTRKRFDKIPTFPRIVKNIERLCLLNKKVRFRIRTNISSFNRRGLMEYVRYLKENHKSWINNDRFEFYFIPIFDAHLSNRNCSKNITDVEFYRFMIYLIKQGLFNVYTHPTLNFLLESLKGTPINTSLLRCKNVVFGPDNKIYHCNLCEKSTVIGNVNDGYIDEPNLRKSWRGQKYNLSKCKKCKYLFLCDGGDRLTAIRESGKACAPACDCYRRNFSAFYKLIINPKLKIRGNRQFIKLGC